MVWLYLFSISLRNHAYADTELELSLVVKFGTPGEVLRFYCFPLVWQYYFEFGHRLDSKYLARSAGATRD